mmetsp:Transcript_17578/g.29068  ORF Transcript_17578/g.29068 Transcript_17578/m.29068 type:complete len:217 (+) Transcript_17578:1052-1702(+)
MRRANILQFVLFATLRWVRGIPFGSPVVPLVYEMKLTSSSSIFSYFTWFKELPKRSSSPPSSSSSSKVTMIFSTCVWVRTTMPEFAASSAHVGSSFTVRLLVLLLLLLSLPLFDGTLFVSQFVIVAIVLDTTITAGFKSEIRVLMSRTRADGLHGMARAPHIFAANIVRMPRNEDGATIKTLLRALTPLFHNNDASRCACATNSPRVRVGLDPGPV